MKIKTLHSSITTHACSEITTVDALINILPEVRDILWRTYNPTPRRGRERAPHKKFTLSRQWACFLNIKIM